MLAPELACAEAVNACVLPTVRERSVTGLRLTLVGKSGVPDLAAFPHPLTLHIQRIATTNRQAFECDLPMHPSLRVARPRAPSWSGASRRMNWKTCSVEAGDGIGKSRRSEGVSARPSRAGASCRDPERSLRRISRGNAPCSTHETPSPNHGSPCVPVSVIVGCKNTG